MAVIPTAQDLGRAVPRPSGRIPNYSADAQVQGLLAQGDKFKGVSAALDRGADELEKLQNERDEMDALKAESYVIKEHLALRDKVKNNVDWTKNSELYNTQAEQIKQNALKLYKNPKQRAKASLAIDNIFARGYEDVRNITRARETDHRNAEDLFLFEQNSNTASIALQNGDQDAALAAIQNQLRNNEILFKSGDRDEITYAKNKISMPQSIVLKALDALPPSQAFELLKPVGQASDKKADKKTIIPQVLDTSEGGFVAIDGASGAPAIYGINEKYHKDAFAEAKRLTETQGEAAGKAYAQEFFTKEYWDKYNLDEFSAPVARVLFDGVINHTPSFRNKLISAAKKGASTDDLIKMRRNEYDRLVTANPEKYGQSATGWENRLINLNAAVKADAAIPPAKGVASLLSPDSLVKARETIEKKMEAEQTKAAIDQLTFADIAQEQQILAKYPDNPSVIAAYEKKRKSLKEDPAGYVTNHPDVAAARQRAEALSAAPNTSSAQKQLASDAYYEKMRDVQRKMGLQPFQTRVVPKEEATKVVDIINNVNANEDQVLNALDPYAAAYGKEGMLSLVENGLKGPAFALTSMSPGTDRTLLVQAIKDGGETLRKLVPSEKVKVVTEKSMPEIQQYLSAITHLPNQAMIAQDTNDAVQTLALKYITRGMDASAAVAQAAKKIVWDNFDVVDTVFVPTGTPRGPITSFISSKSNFLKQFDLYVPPQVQSAPEQYKKNLLIDATVRTVGNSFYFYGPDQNPLLDASRVKTSPDGRVINPIEAAISIPITDAVRFGKQEEISKESSKPKRKGARIKIEPGSFQ